jgi:membrane-bound lytic murein transglycosylase B
MSAGRLRFYIVLAGAILAAILCAPVGHESTPWTVASALAQQPEEAALEADHAFRLHIETLWPEARAHRISRTTFDKALSEMYVDWRVLDRANYQPEHEFAIGDYLARIASPARIEEGRGQLAKHADVFHAVEATYGVDRHVIAAVWGIESNFGAAMGDHGVLRALGMLAWKGGRRADFGRQQLIAALRILERGDIEPARMLGSWAGAMGHTQFIPTTYSQHAVDFDKDGRRDIWGTIPDALASTANYLKVSGWRTALPWGYEVSLPDGFDYGLMDREFSLQEWARRGVAAPQGATASRSGIDQGSVARLLVPAGASGPSFLMTGNFRAILKYNNATSYALAVGHLADRLAGGSPFVRTWPVDERPLKRREREELQALLTAQGLYKGEIDGLFGDQTKAALLAWQRSAGLIPDAYASERMLALLKRKQNP